MNQQLLKLLLDPDLDEILLNGGISPFFTRAFKFMANIYRKKHCKGRSRPLMKGELHYPLCMNYNGPGTRVDIKKIANYRPYNNIDNCARNHDLAYLSLAEKPDAERRRGIRKADEEILKCYDRYKNEQGYKISKLGINSKMRIEDVIPLVARAVLGKLSGKGLYSDTMKQYKRDDLLQIIRNYNRSICIRKYSKLTFNNLKKNFNNNFKFNKKGYLVSKKYKYKVDRFKRQKITRKFILQVMKKNRKDHCIKNYSTLSKNELIKLIKKYVIQN